jgi:hypothetical protein
MLQLVREGIRFKAKKAVSMFLIELFMSTVLICKFLAAVSYASISLIYPASRLKMPSTV